MRVEKSYEPLDLGPDIHDWQSAADLGQLICSDHKQPGTSVNTAANRGATLSGYAIEKREATPEDIEELDLHHSTRFLFRVKREGVRRLPKPAPKPEEPAPKPEEPAPKPEKPAEGCEDCASLKAEVEELQVRNASQVASIERLQGQLDQLVRQRGELQQRTAELEAQLVRMEESADAQFETEVELEMRADEIEHQAKPLLDALWQFATGEASPELAILALREHYE